MPHTRLPRKPQVYIQVTHPGSLKKLGYSLYDSAVQRRKSLLRAVKSPKIGYKSTMAKVNTLYVWNKRRQPKLAQIAEKDKQWLMKLHAKSDKSRKPKRKAKSRKPKAKKSPRKKSKKKSKKKAKRKSKHKSKRKSKKKSKAKRKSTTKKSRKRRK